MRGIERRGETGYTGKFLEADMFGERFAKGDNADADYLSYDAALEQVKESYSKDPTDPQPLFANDLHAEVAEELGLEDYSELKLYSAVNSALDRYHGVDAFFEHRGARVTMDVTKNPAKTEGYKADIILGEEELDYPVRRTEKAKEIAMAIQAEAAELKRQQEAAGAQPRRLRRSRLRGK